jgi:SAM-dependent methyltransferase
LSGEGRLSVERLYDHRRLWEEKPVLAQVYEPWFAALLAEAPVGGRVLEVGAGPGLFAPHAKEKRPDLRWTASDLHPVPWNAVAADAGRLPIRDRSVSTVLGLDVLHHLPEPARFFAEAARVLRPGGSLALVEPWITPLSWVVYRFFHQERCRLSVDPWQPFPREGKDSFDGDAAVPWRIVRDTDEARWRSLGYDPPRVRRVNALAYVATLGFRKGSLLPEPLARPALWLERAMGPFAPLLALRASIVWRLGASEP